MVDAPNWGRDVPASIVAARDYFIVKNPGSFFRVISPVNQVLALAGGSFVVVGAERDLHDMCGGAHFGGVGRHFYIRLLLPAQRDHVCRSDRRCRRDQIGAVRLAEHELDTFGHDRCHHRLGLSGVVEGWSE